jgi:hypothetical protein
MKRLLVAMVVGALSLTACAQRGTDLGAPVSTESERVSEESSPTGSHRKTRQKSRGRPNRAVAPADNEAPAPVDIAGSQTATGCSPATGGGDHLAQLTDVRVGTHPGYDRVTFEFAPPENGPGAFGVPRYEIARMTPPITEDPSGHRVAVDGHHYAGIVFHGGTGVDLTTSDSRGYEVTYGGPREIKPGFGVLAEAQETGDFEATMSWAFGLNRASCWRVSQLNNPVRVVVDFLH